MTDNNENLNNNDDLQVQNQEKEKEIINNADTSEDKVPLSKFLDKKNELKDLKAKLAEFEDKERKLADQKLLEEKQYQELLKKKEDELKNLQDSLFAEKTNNKLEKIKNIYSKELLKNNVFNVDDALALSNINDLLEYDSPENEIKTRVENLVKNKTYLFNTKSQRSDSENNTLAQNLNNVNLQNLSTRDKILQSLMNKNQ